MNKSTAQAIADLSNSTNKSMKRLNEMLSGRCDNSDKKGNENSQSIEDNNDAIMELVEIVSENSDAIMELVELISVESEGI